MYQCNDSLAVAHRNQQLIQLRKTLTKVHTNPLLTNHIVNSLQQLVNGFQTPKIKIVDASTGDGRADPSSINELLEIGVDNIISGVVSNDATEVQRRYAVTYNVGEHFSILS